MIAEAINKIGDAADSVSDLVSSKKEFVIKQSINVVLLLIILLLFGCFDFLHLTFHYEYLIDGNFWISVVTKAAADVAAYNIGINVIIDDMIKRNKVLANLKTIYENLNQYKDQDFPDFIYEYNRECKIQAYKNKITKMIYMLNKFSKKKDKLLYSSKIATEEEKSQNKYCIRRKQLETLKTDEYIKENIDSLDINYRDVDPAVFDLEINGEQKIIENKVVGSVNRGRAVMSFTTILGVMIAPIIINSIALDPNAQELEDGVIAGLNYAIRIASDIGIIIWQFSRGILSTHKIVSREITIPLSARVSILKKYYAWRDKKGLNVPQYYRDLLEEPVYATMSKEEYLKMKENNL